MQCRTTEQVMRHVGSDGRRKGTVMRGVIVTGMVCLLAAGSALADTCKGDAEPEVAVPTEAPDDAEATPSRSEALEAARARAPVIERAETSSHSVELGGRTIDYEATAGTLTLRDDDGNPTASVFYVAYTAESTGSSPRPVTFFYNGGPGSASLWLHMGSFAPVRVNTGTPESMGAPPYDYGPNPYSLIDRTDMVFIDAVGTGYSRPLEGTDMAAFSGVEQDAEAFAGAIVRYVTRHHRWNAPRFLFGESYGTTRSAILAEALQDRGVAMNGVILLSSILDFTALETDRKFISLLPSYTAAAWYHHQLPERPASLEDALQRARDFASRPYAAALARGDVLDTSTATRVAENMSVLTGLSVDFLLQANLRVEPWQFRKELLRDQRLTLGRFDARYTGRDADAVGEGPDWDPSEAAITSAYRASLQDYLGRTLGYDSDLDYRIFANGELWQNWDWSRPNQMAPRTTIDLSAAIRRNPELRVLSLNGYYDLATPFFGTEYDLAHLSLDPPLAQNLRAAYFPAGHMIYLNPEALAGMREEVVQFIGPDDTEAPASFDVQPVNMTSSVVPDG